MASDLASARAEQRAALHERMGRWRDAEKPPAPAEDALGRLCEALKCLRDLIAGRGHHGAFISQTAGEVLDSFDSVLNPSLVDKAVRCLEACGQPHLARRVEDIGKTWREGLPALRSAIGSPVEWTSFGPAREYAWRAWDDLFNVWEALCGAPAAPASTDDPQSPVASPPFGADVLDESDVAILTFLNQNPKLRRKVSDVLPENGPCDRKAIGIRLRALADRSPPLVDYPEGVRKGVAITDAGIKALTQATAVMPR